MCACNTAGHISLVFFKPYCAMFLFYFSVCTPVGVARMFTVMGQLVVKPKVSWFYIFIFSSKEGKKKMFYLMTHATHFISGYMASDIW